ncbi:ATP-dependent bile acid permease [Hyphodiscus hymeniophilus]|uniref:ATP-dependent bile acid permease n=1 Tax=Hyphodiscus hymeniophilus TaxID=353542 RepID=A0A9P6VQP9_9HELO|nr:ATP-dependent bile acid permease [Hyphodiscus hymeniophilus]
MDGNIANASYAFFILTAVFSLPSISRIAKRPWRVKTVYEGLYEDDDGVATEESMSKFSTKGQFAVISGASGLGLAVSFALAVFATVRREKDFSDLCLVQVWLLFPAWLLDTALEEGIIIKFQRASYNLASCCFIAILAWMTLLGQMPGEPDSTVLVVCSVTQVVAVFTIATAIFLIERRPDVYRPDGRVVERQYQSSLWARYTFSWSSEILDLAATKLIDNDDMPAPDTSFRSNYIKAKFREISLKPTLKLWALLLWTFWYPLAWQWSLIAISTLFDVAPQFAMLKLLQFLEARQGFDAIDPQAWLWVAAMFAVTVGSTIIDHRIFWLMMCDIAIPMRSILTALIFEKMMKLKNIKEPPKIEESKDAPKLPNGNTDDAPKSKDKPEAQTQQDIVNMFAVDTNLVAVFGANNQFYLNFVCRVILAIAFLWYLVGWESMLAGMASMCILYPINHMLGRRYANYQKALMKARDGKTTVITEALNGIRQIKFSAIERQWTEKIDEVREKELQKIWETRLNNILMGVASDFTPVLFAVFALATYTYIHGDLLPSIAFTAMSLFIQLEGLTGMIPMLLVFGVNAKVSADRIDNFLARPEKPENTYPGDSVSFDKAVISFPSDAEKGDEDRFILRDINLEFPNGALSVISGPTGSGKSLLLAAMLGEAEVLSGNIRVPRPPPIQERFDNKATSANWILPTAIAFVSQTPWIENATIKNNILFGLPFDSKRYNEVISACALTKDLAMFEDGDSTEVGAQGISLSGGQKWRLTLARAFYSRAGILILDDVFSALDAHVGKEIYDKAMTGPLSEGRTRILVTHHVQLVLPRAKYAVRLGARGTLEHAGLTEELRQTGSYEDIMDADDSTINVTDTETGASSAITLQEPLPSSVVPIVVDETPAPAKPTPKKLVEDEHREVGGVKKSVYLTYLRATGGFPFWSFVFVIYIAAQSLSMGRSWWIKIWTATYEHSKGQVTSVAHSYTMQTQMFSPIFSSSSINVQSSNSTLGYYLGIYVAISAASVVVAGARYYFIYSGSLRASRNVFQKMTYSVLHTPLRWLDTVPTGRILNRFTADFQNLDSQLAMNFAYVAGTTLEIVGILIAAFFISPYMILLSVVLLVICAQITRRYLGGARSIKRLESIQKSPMISHFGSSLEGLSTIRAFSNADTFIGRAYGLIDSFSVATWHNQLFNGWVGFRMAMVGSIFSSAVAAFVVSTRGVDASLAGFALAFALDYRNAAIRAIRLLASTELDMNAAERIFEYADLETEPQGGIENLRASWPEQGKLEVRDLEVGYAADLPSILKGLTFTAASNQRIGVVGRTGAGKSTLSLALFRFLEARKGSIVIDGVDISTIKLHDLRTRLAIIPQDPVLFSGTIRSNLDPFDEFSDVQLREALQRVHLVPSSDSTPMPEAQQVVAESSVTTSSTAFTVDLDSKSNINIFLSLSSPISSSGSNLSQGQKQLLCLARSILSRPRLLLLDEATSAVDMMTDALIQRSIREEFSNTTLLVVAHRLSTVADFDRILVMRDGVAAEFGSPKELLQKEDGIFKGMVAQSGEKEELEKSILEL